MSLCVIACITGYGRAQIETCTRPWPFLVKLLLEPDVCMVAAFAQSFVSHAHIGVSSFLVLCLSGFQLRLLLLLLLLSFFSLAGALVTTASYRALGVDRYPCCSVALGSLSLFPCV